MGSNAQAGFTATELTIVLSILSLLALVGVPNYRAYVMRSRQMEAKIALANVHSLESLYRARNGTYTYCLGEIGLPMKDPARYYAVGFAGENLGAQRCRPGNTAFSCATAYWTRGPAKGRGLASIDWIPDNKSPKAGQCDLSIAKRDGSGPASGQVSANLTAFEGHYAGNAHLTHKDNPNGVADCQDMTDSSFKACAAGYISSSGKVDHWQIDQDKLIYNF